MNFVPLGKVLYLIERPNLIPSVRRIRDTVSDVKDFHMLVASCWVLVASFWLLASCCSFLDAGCSLMVARYWLESEIKKPESRNWILDSGCWMLVSCRRLLGLFILNNALLRIIFNSRLSPIFVLGLEVIPHYHLQISINPLA
jgi:hypothetical protein